MKANYQVDYVDAITEPGMDKAIAEGSLSLRTALQQKTLISVNVHGSAVIAVVGHDDCAGNPVANELHRKQIQRSVEIVKTWVRGAQVIGLWLDDKWQVTKVV